MGHDVRAGARRRGCGRDHVGAQRRHHLVHQRGENPTYLPGIALSDRISATAEITEAVAGHELVVVAVPVKAVRATLSAAREAFAPGVALLSLAKGLELGSLKRVDEIIAEASGVPENRIAVLSGPNLSREIAQRQPTATVVAASDVELAKEIAKACHNPYFPPLRVHRRCGHRDGGRYQERHRCRYRRGRGHGPGHQHALDPHYARPGGDDAPGYGARRGPRDLRGPVRYRRPRRHVFLATVAKLLLGHRLGSGMGLAEALALSLGVVEGVASAAPILQVAASVGVDMPITGAVVEVVEGRASIEDMGRMLLARPQKMDGWKIELV